MAEVKSRSELAAELQLIMSRKIFEMPFGKLTMRRQTAVRTSAEQIIRTFEGQPPTCPDCGVLMRKVQEPYEDPRGMAPDQEWVHWSCECKPVEEVDAEEELEAAELAGFDAATGSFEGEEAEVDEKDAPGD